MVVDELFVKKGTEFLPVDSLDNQMIDEIVYEGESLHFAKQKDLTGTSEIVADNGVAEPIRSLVVSGNTVQNGTPTPETPCPIENANDSGMSVVVHGDNIIDQDDMVNGGTITKAKYNEVECIKVAKNGTFDIPFEVPANTPFSFSYERAFPKSDYYWFLKYEDGTFESGAFTSGYYPNTSQEQFQKVTKTNITRTKKIVAIQMRFYGGVNNGYYPMYFRNIMANLGTTVLPYQPYFLDEISIPKSVEVGGEAIPLRLTKWDNITVDRQRRKVIYTEGSWQRAMTGEENWRRTANQSFELYNMTTQTWSVIPEQYTGYCSDLVQKNSYWGTHGFATSSAERLLFAWTDRTSTVEEFKAYLKQRYAEGNPVVFLLRREKSNIIEHDITNTDLGQSLLALATGKGTNYLEITSNLAPSQTDLSYWRQIIPNE